MIPWLFVAASVALVVIERVTRPNDRDDEPPTWHTRPPR